MTVKGQREERWNSQLTRNPTNSNTLILVSLCVFQTLSVSMLLRYSHHQIFVFIGQFPYHVSPNQFSPVQSSMFERINDIDMNSCVSQFNIVLVQWDEAQSSSVLGSVVKLSGPVEEVSCQTS